jgi:hypothetical protein
MAERRHYPSQIDLGSPAMIENAIRLVIDDVYAELRRIESRAVSTSTSTSASTGTTGTGALAPTSITNVTNVTNVSSGGTPSSGTLTLAIIKAALERNGSHQLDVMGLSGLLQTYQRAKVEESDTLPSALNAIDGQLAYYDGGMYRFDSGSRTWQPIGGASTGGGGGITLGLHSARPSAPSTIIGSLYYSTDRTILTVWNGTGWNWVGGMHRAPIASLPTPTAAEAGYTFYATDYAHVWVWTGAAWIWGPGEIGSRYIQLWTTTPDMLSHAPQSWTMCTGFLGAPKVVDCCTSAGTLSSVTVPDLVTLRPDGVYLKAADRYDPAIVYGGAGFPPTGVEIVSAGTGTYVNVAPAEHVHPVNVDHILTIAYYRR